MVKISFGEDFKKTFTKIRDDFLKSKVIKQIEKIKNNPEAGKPLKYRRGERSIYIKPFRLIYAIKGDEIIILKFDHRKKVYK